MVEWDIETQLNEEEEKLQRKYAREIVKSIQERESDPLKLRILLMSAADIAYEVWFAATDFSIKEPK
jgi:hypothetical protein